MGNGDKTAALWMGQVTTRFMDSEDIYNIAVDFTNLATMACLMSV